MALIEHDSRNKVGIDWYDDLTEAEVAGAKAREAGKIAQSHGYDFGYLSCGRDRGFDKTKDGIRLFAVVTP